MTQVLILCAGLGSRLGVLSQELPKPLVPVGDRPILRHIADELVRHDVSEALINLHHQWKAFDTFDAGALQLRSVFEPEILGTAGAVASVRDQLGHGPLLVWNGDILAEPPIAELLARAEESGLCLLVDPLRGHDPSGTLGLDERGHVVRLRGESFGHCVRFGNYVGIMAISEALMPDVPTRGCLIGDVCLPRLRRGSPVATLSYEGRWSDVGSLGAYQEANLRWLGDRGLNEYVAGTARVAPSVHLRQSLVHAGATVTGEGELVRCIVWPGASVVAPLSDSVLLARGDIVPLVSSQ